jgi:hypothetical protein
MMLCYNGSSPHNYGVTWPRRKDYCHRSHYLLRQIRTKHLSVIFLEFPKLNGGSTTQNLEIRAEGNRFTKVSDYIIHAGVWSGGRLTEAGRHYYYTYDCC